MAQKTKAQLLADINSFITTNGNKEITGAILNQLLIDLNDSLANLSTDSELIGLNEFDVARTYALGDCMVYQNEIYQSGEIVSPGVLDLAQWVKLTTLSDPATDYDFVPYENATTYNIDDRVEFAGKLFKCDINGTVGIFPDDISANWTEISAGTGLFGLNYTTETLYKLGDVVTYTDNKLYIKTALTTPFYSTDFATELSGLEWVLFHQLNKTDVGLSNVDNTSDLNKPISTLTQTALDSKVEFWNQSVTTTNATLTTATGSKTTATNTNYDFVSKIVGRQTVVGADGVVGNVYSYEVAGAVQNIAGTTTLSNITGTNIIEGFALPIDTTTGHAVTVSISGQNVDFGLKGLSGTIVWTIKTIFTEI